MNKFNIGDKVKIVWLKWNYGQSYSRLFNSIKHYIGSEAIIVDIVHNNEDIRYKLKSDIVNPEFLFEDVELELIKSLVIEQFEDWEDDY